jgi:predicted O-methyltransferase YrrM
VANKVVEKYLPGVIEQSINGTGDSDRHLLTLFSVALATRGATYLELGVRDGSTTLPLLLAAHLNGGKLISVDINDTTFSCPQELAPHWQFVQSDAIAFLKTLDPGKPLDFVFIDDWHTYPHVKKELALLQRVTTPSSVLFLHDLMYSGTEPSYHTNPEMWKGEWAGGGPYRAVNQLNRRIWEWATLPWASGLTLLRKKAPIVQESRIKMWIKRLYRQMIKKKIL